MGTLTAEVLAKMKPSYPLRLAEQEPEEVETDRLWLARDVFFFFGGRKAWKELLSIERETLAGLTRKYTYRRKSTEHGTWRAWQFAASTLAGYRNVQQRDGARCFPLIWRRGGARAGKVQELFCTNASQQGCMRSRHAEQSPGHTGHL